MAHSEAKGLYQIIDCNSINHAQLSPNSNHYYWTTIKTSIKTSDHTNTTVLSQKLMQDTINAIKKDVNRQIYGIYPAPQVDYGNHIIRKGTRDLRGADHRKLLGYT